MTVITGIVESTTGTSTVVPDQIDQNADTPDIITAAYTRSKSRWQRCRDLMKGADAIRDGGDLYLPQHPNETDERYDIRKVIAALYNCFARTVDATVGLLMQQEPTLGDDMKQPFLDMWENIDGNGTHGAVFANRLTRTGVVDGFAGIVTEYPRTSDPNLDRSKASYAATESLSTGQALDASDERAMGLQPYFVLTKADEVRLALHETRNGKRTLVLLILCNYVTVRKGRYGIASKQCFRVYRLDGTKILFEEWEATQNGPATQVGEPIELKNLKRVPWSPLICGEELSPGEYKPTLEDLAILNIEHHNIKTGILSLQDLAFVPTPVRIGAVPTLNAETNEYEYPDLVLGPSNTIEAPATQGVSEPVYWLSPPIDVLEPAMKSLENCAGEMGAMGASFLVPLPRRTDETATAHLLDSTAEKASIATVGRAVQDCLELAFEYAGEYIGVDSGSVTVNHDFESTMMSPQMLTAYVNAVVNAGLPVPVFLAAMQKGGLIESGQDLDELAAEMMADQQAIEDQKALDAAAALKNKNAPPAPAE